MLTQFPSVRGYIYTHKAIINKGSNLIKKVLICLSIPASSEEMNCGGRLRRSFTLASLKHELWVVFLFGIFRANAESYVHTWESSSKFCKG